MPSTCCASRILIAALAVFLPAPAGAAGTGAAEDEPRGSVCLVAPGEPGEPLVVTGKILGGSGKPVAGARLRVFQADAAGRYTPGKAMDERNALLAAEFLAGTDGSYEIRTIRPGGYPDEFDMGGGVKRKIPGHIHFEIDAPGHSPRRAQMVFDDDPRMTDYWRGWARRGNNPVVELVRDGDGVLRGEHDWTLEAE